MLLSLNKLKIHESVWNQSSRQAVGRETNIWLVHLCSLWVRLDWIKGRGEARPERSSVSRDLSREGEIEQEGHDEGVLDTNVHAQLPSQALQKPRSGEKVTSQGGSRLLDHRGL